MTETVNTILDFAQLFVQTRGFNAFSYADISTAVGIKTASIHYHFPSKGDLGKALVERYRTVFLEKLRQMDDDELKADDKLRLFVNLYLDTLQDGKICLCGMLATDIDTLPEAVQDQVRMFFAENEAWLARVFRDGRNSRTLNVEGNVEMKAKIFMSGVYGAMLISKAINSEERFITLTQDLLNTAGAGR